MIYERSAATSNPVGNQEPRRAPPIASAHSRVRRQVYQCYWEQVGRSMDDRRGEGSGADCDSLSYFPPFSKDARFGARLSSCSSWSSSGRERASVRTKYAARCELV